MTRTLRPSALLFSGLAAATLAAPALADGEELLGAPQGLVLESGTDFVIAGVGLVESQANPIALTLPEGAVVRQVIAYWDGLAQTGNLPGDVDTIALNGQAVTGYGIGGPTPFFGSFHSFAFRADVTHLDLFAGITAGNATVTAQGLDFGYANNGLGIVVVLDDGSDATLAINDGSDYAYEPWGALYGRTEPVTYDFDAAQTARTAQLGFMVGGVDAGRPNAVHVSIDGVHAYSVADPFGSQDGPEWDTLELDVEIPAGATSVTVEPASIDLGYGPYAGGQVASLNWVFSSFQLSAGDDAPQFGCSPHEWKCNWWRWDAWCTSDNVTETVVLNDRFNETFGVDCWQSGLWSQRRLWHGLTGMGSWWNWQRRLLNRQAVAALANADAGMNYPLTVAEVKALYRDAVGAEEGPETISSALEQLYLANSLGCPW